MTEHKRTVNYRLGRKQAAFHLPATTKVEKKINIDADVFSPRREHLPVVSVLEYVEKHFAHRQNEINFSYSQYIAIFAQLALQKHYWILDKM